MCMLSKKEGRIEEMLDAVGLEAEKERGILKRYPEPHGQVTAYNRSPVH